MRKIAEYPDEIVQRVAEFISEGDLDGVVSMFHPECKIAMNPDSEPDVGHEAVRAIFADFVIERATLKGVVSGSLTNGNLAIIQGQWSIEDRDGVVLGGGVSTEVAKRLDSGGWVYFIDCPISVPMPIRE